MSKIKTQRWLIILTVALLGTNIVYPTDINTSRFNSNIYNSIFLTLWVILLYIGIKRDKIQKVLNFDWVIGFIFSSLYCATLIVNYSISSDYFYNGINAFFTLFSWISWAVIFSVTFTFIQTYFGKVMPKVETVPPKIYLWGLLTIIWIVSIVFLLPGQISWDGLKQLCEFEGTRISQLDFTYSPTNHHPWFTTIIFGSLFNIGRSILGVNFGIFTIIFVQFIVSSLIYTAVIRFVWEKVGKVGGIFTFLLFASPIFSSYIVTVDKSTFYYAFTAWFYLCFAKLFEYLNNKEWSYKDVFFYVLSATLVGLFRNDAFLVIIVATAILIIFALKSKRKLILTLISLVIVLGIHMGWNAYLSRENVVKSSPAEALTLPIRQLSYVYINDPKSFSKSNLRIIDRITNLKEIKNKFDINNGDYLKSLYPSDTFLNTDKLIKDVVDGKKTLNTTKNEKKDTIRYLKLWLSVGLRHPGQYIKVYLAANSRYLNPFIMYDGALFINYYPEMPFFMQPSWYKEYYPLFNNNVRDISQQILMMITMFPPLAIVGNPAILVWATLFLLFVLIKFKDLKGIGFLMPLLVMCMLFTVTSINGYTRYTIGALAAFPVVITYLWKRTYDVYQIMKEK